LYYFWLQFGFNIVKPKPISFLL